MIISKFHSFFSGFNHTEETFLQDFTEIMNFSISGENIEEMFPRYFVTYEEEKNVGDISNNKRKCTTSFFISLTYFSFLS